MSYEKVFIGNCHMMEHSYAEGMSVIHVNWDQKRDWVTIYDQDGIEMMSGSSDFMNKLGYYLSGQQVTDVIIEKSEETTQQVEKLLIKNIGRK